MSEGIGTTTYLCLYDVGHVCVRVCGPEITEERKRESDREGDRLHLLYMDESELEYNAAPCPA